MTKDVRMRIRHNAAVPMAGGVATLAGSALAGSKVWLLPLLLLPLGYVWWGLRSGTDADRHTITVRRMFSSRRIAWDDVAGLRATPTSVHAELKDGGEVPLIAVTEAHVPALLELAQK